MAESNRSYITKEAIRQALLRRIETDDITHVKVRDIVADARVSKATFYRHYKDVYDLLVDCFACYLEVHEELDDALDSNNVVEFQYQLTLLGVRKIKQYPRLYLMCHKSSYGPLMADFASRSMFRSVDAMVNYIEQFGSGKNNCIIDVRQLATLCIDLSIAINVHWLDNGCVQTPEEISRLTTVCISRFVDSMFVNS
jgi:AcrR family transcriptional regulator